MSSTHFVRTPFTIVDIDISHDEDWFDPLPQLLDEEGEPVTLSGSQSLDLYIRPTYDHSILLKQLSSQAGTGIVIDSGVGYATISLPRSTVVAELPVGEWDQFLVLAQTPTPNYVEVWRGKLRVHAGLVPNP